MYLNIHSYDWWVTGILFWFFSNHAFYSCFSSLKVSSHCICCWKRGHLVQLLLSSEEAVFTKQPSGRFWGSFPQAFFWISLFHTSCLPWGWFLKLYVLSWFYKAWLGVGSLPFVFPRQVLWNAQIKPAVHMPCLHWYWCLQVCAQGNSLWAGLRHEGRESHPQASW